MGRHRSTISRELRRNCSRHDGGYRYQPAQEQANERRSRSRRKSHFTAADWKLIETLLREKLSPEQISGRLRREGRLLISHETIYLHIWRDKKRGGRLYRHLRQRPKYRKRYGTNEKRGRLAGKRHSPSGRPPSSADGRSVSLHPDKTRRVDLSWSKEGFDFLGCHLRKRLSGTIWEKERRRVYFLQRGPSQRSMKRVRQRVKELTPKARCHEDIREVIADVNPVLRGWGNYFRTGNASYQFTDIDQYIHRRLRALRIKRKGRNLWPGEADTWTRDYFYGLGLHRLHGTIQYPEVTECRFPRDHR